MIRWIIPDLKTFQFIHAFNPHISTIVYRDWVWYFDGRNWLMTDKMGLGPNGQISDCMIRHKHISFFLSLFRMVVSQLNLSGGYFWKHDSHKLQNLWYGIDRIVKLFNKTLSSVPNSLQILVNYIYVVS